MKQELNPQASSTYNTFHSTMPLPISKLSLKFRPYPPLIDAKINNNHLTYDFMSYRHQKSRWSNNLPNSVLLRVCNWFRNVLAFITYSRFETINEISI